MRARATKDWRTKPQKGKTAPRWTIEKKGNRVGTNYWVKGLREFKNWAKGKKERVKKETGQRHTFFFYFYFESGREEGSFSIIFLRQGAPDPDIARVPDLTK